MAILHEMTPLVEQISIDEAFLDMSDQVSDWSEAVELASRLQARVREEIGLSASLGVATNKQVAKVASDLHKPGGLTIVPPGTEAEFLAPLPARALWGVGPVTAGRLAEMGVTTIGELAAVPDVTLRAAFRQARPGAGRTGARHRRQPGGHRVRAQVVQPGAHVQPRPVRVAQLEGATLEDESRCGGRPQARGPGRWHGSDQAALQRLHHPDAPDDLWPCPRTTRSRSTARR